MEEQIIRIYLSNQKNQETETIFEAKPFNTVKEFIESAKDAASKNPDELINLPEEDEKGNRLYYSLLKEKDGKMEEFYFPNKTLSDYGIEDGDRLVFKSQAMEKGEIKVLIKYDGETRKFTLDEDKEFELIFDELIELAEKNPSKMFKMPRNFPSKNPIKYYFKRTNNGKTQVLAKKRSDNSMATLSDYKVQEDDILQMDFIPEGGALYRVNNIKNIVKWQ